MNPNAGLPIDEGSDFQVKSFTFNRGSKVWTSLQGGADHYSGEVSHGGGVIDRRDTLES